MKNDLKKILAIAISLIGSSVPAQVSKYSFTQTTGQYGPVNTGSLVGNIIQDDDITQASLPFAFNFNGTSYNSVNVSSNGYISFGSPQLNSYKPISGFPQNIISPFGHDLVMGMVTVGDITAGSNTITNLVSTAGIQAGDSLFDFTFDFGGQSPVIIAINGNDIVVSAFATNNNAGADLFILNGSLRQTVSGSAPNRICEFEYRNFSRFSVYNDIVNFKVRLYETSNKIEFAYGSMQPGASLSAPEIGLRGAGIHDFNSRKVDPLNPWASSAASTQITDSCHFGQTIFPAANLVYQWTPVNCTQPAITISRTNTMICTGQSATLTASGASSYTWSTGVVSNSIVVAPLVTTAYSLAGFSSGCTGTLSVQLLVSKCTNVDESDEDQNAIKLYPNPFQSELVVENKNSIDTSYDIMSIEGTLIAKGSLKGKSTETIRTDTLLPGIYFITLNSGKMTVVKKIVKV